MGLEKIELDDMGLETTDKEVDVELVKKDMKIFDETVLALERIAFERHSSRDQLAQVSLVEIFKKNQDDFSNLDYKCQNKDHKQVWMHPEQ